MNMEGGRKIQHFHALSGSDALTHLNSSPEGLSSEEARRRLETYGENALFKAKTAHPLQLLWSQINNPLIWVLIVSALVTIFVDPTDGYKNGLVILGVVFLNTLIGFIQEYKASRAIEALVEMVPENSSALRDGKKVCLPSAQLVPGDIVLLASGDRVPADMRVLESKNLHAEEAALTGESVPVHKDAQPVDQEASLGDRSSLVYGGTVITHGAAKAAVVATGENTELGKISDLLDQVTDLQTPMTKALAQISKWIAFAIIILAVAILVIGSLRTVLATGVDFISALRETAIFAIALAVGAIPEGLPAIVTITLAIGVQRMARRRAVIRKLPAVETLGSTSVICTDKTGTLTRNEMTVTYLWSPLENYHVTGVGYKPHGEIVDRAGNTVETLPSSAKKLLEIGVLCNDAELIEKSGNWQISGDPTEGALLVSALKSGLDIQWLRDEDKRLDVIPFESENMFMATLHSHDDSLERVILKGAPEVVFQRCNETHGCSLETFTDEVQRLASQGMRVLAFAEKCVPKSGTLSLADTDQGFTFLGLQAMIDPPRIEAIEAVKICQKAGIRVIMITGDHKETARAIGAELGLIANNQSAISGAELNEILEKRPDQLQKVLQSSGVFARVDPEHKLILVRTLQSMNHIVAMTGDGVNDAPALRQSNIGVAMGITGTAVSKDASDIVLTDDNFASIASAVEEGRRVYDNLIKALAFILPTNLGLALVLVYAVLFFPFGAGELLVPVQPTQILWINLVAAITLALPLAFEAKEPDLMSRPPRNPSKPVLSPFVISRTVIVATMMTAGAIGLFQYEFQAALTRGIPRNLAIAEAQTLAVTTIIMFQIFYLLNCRSLRDSIFRIGLFSNPIVFIGIAALLVFQWFFIYTEPFQKLFGTRALSGSELLLATLVGALILPVITVEKAIRNRRKKKHVNRRQEDPFAVAH